MASIAKEPNGTRRIQFKALDSKRKTLRLGKVSQKIAETYRTHVEHLVTSLRMKWSAPDETIRWLSELDETMRDKLVAVGLCPRRESQLLGRFLEEYIDGRKDVKPSTLTVYGHTRRYLISFYGADKPLREIHSGSADEFRLFLIGTEKLSENTVRRRCGIDKQFFRAAQRRKLIAENPFADLVAVVRGNPSRYYYVTRQEAEQVLAACPDAQWRLLFALSRYGGLRAPWLAQRLARPTLRDVHARLHVRDRLPTPHRAQ